MGAGREVSLEEFPLSQGLSTGETVRAEEIVLQAPDGRSVTTLINATSIRSEEGEVESVVVTMQDMTPMEELERLRAEFLGMVSHELRTPLAAIKGSAATLTEAASDLDPAEMLQFFRIIGEQADYMRDLIGDLLDVARIETGELSVAPAPADVATLVDEARSRFQSGGGRTNLRIDLSPELPLVMADGRRIIQVLNNLLTNAARHSHEASAIGVSAVREGYHVAVSVTDEGRGIAAERLPHLFRKFSRIDGEDRRRDIAGSGLGLAICKGIVEAHGGRIWAESDGPGLGARFTFTIPVAQGAAIGAAHLPVRSRRSERERERILAVDDDPQTLRYVRDALTNAGYAPIVTGDPQEATSLVRANDPGLVLLDLLKAALRQRPNAILIGEIRGEEGAVAFQAMQTGHQTTATFHAASVQKLIQRLTGEPINIPKTYIDNLNIVVIQNSVRLPGGKMGRRATSVSEIVGYDSPSDSFSFIEIFRWDPVTDKFNFVGGNNSYILESKIAFKRGIPPEKKRLIYRVVARRAKILEKIHQSGITGFYELLQVLAKAQRDDVF